MNFGKACCALSDNEEAIGKLDKSRRSNGFTKRFGKNLANSEIA
jgi:hypothetical protein